MAAKSSSHIHKFKRHHYKSGNDIFFCALPDCQQKLNIALALGKKSICWRCGESFIMSEYSLRLSKPHCENCHKPKNESSKTEIYNEEQHEESKYDEPLSLAERLEQTIKQAQQTTEEEEI